MLRQKEGNKISLLGRMTFAPEARSDATPKPVIQGRFKYFFSLFKLNNNYFMLINLLFLLFCLPLIAVLLLPNIFGGMENVHYLINKISAPYFMDEVGIGLSLGQSLMDVQLGILKVYHYMFLCVALCLPIVSLGASGLFHTIIKFVWMEQFITKKDSYGNNVPRVGVEFFQGVKKHFAQMLFVFIILALITMGASSGIVFFIKSFWLGNAVFWHWLLLIFSCAVSLFGVMLLIFISPMVPMYEISFLSKLKNAIILIITMFLPALFVAILTILPIILINSLDGFVRVLLMAALLIFGSTFYGLMWTNFVQYYAEKIITPVYEAQISKQNKKSGNRKKKK